MQEQHLLLWCSGDAGRDMTVEVGKYCDVEPEGGVQRAREYLNKVRASDSTGGSLRVMLLGE
jgi:hypothetical protein